MTTIAMTIASNVASRREALNWSQNDLAAELTSCGGDWSRPSVGMLESRGVRAERLSDLVVMCLALNVSLSDLLASPSEITLRNGPALQPARILEILDGVSNRQPDSSGSARGVGADDPEESRRMADRWGISVSKLEAVIRQWGGPQATPAAYRDCLAGIRLETPKGTAQALRGHAARKLGEAILRNPRGIEKPPDWPDQQAFENWLQEVVPVGDREPV